MLKIHLKEKCILLKITPSESTIKTPSATREFFKILRFLSLPYLNLTSLFFPQKRIYSLEIVAKKETGIRFIMRIPQKDENSVKRALYSFMPFAKIEKIDDYMKFKDNSSSKFWAFLELNLLNHFCFPLAKFYNLSQHDPISYITGNMARLEDNESILMQLLISPVTKNTHKKLIKTISQILNCIEIEDNISPFIKQKGILFYSLSVLFSLFNLAVILPFSLFFYILTLGKSKLFPLFPHSHMQNNVFLTKSQKLIYQNIQKKVSHELLESSLRFIVVSNTKETAKSLIDGFSASLSSFATPNQSLNIKKNNFLTKIITDKLNLFRLKHRLLSFKNLILDTDEITGLYHFPYVSSTNINEVNKVKSKTLSPSLELKNSMASFCFAKNSYAEKETKIGLTSDERRRHVYILGATGTGKTTLLTTMICQDILQGKGLCVIDPHGDLIEKILTLIPKKRISDTILFDPSDCDFPIGLNLLELPNEVNDLEKEKDLIASQMVSVFSKLTPARFWGQRMENILRVVTFTALETQKPNLFTMQRILLDNKYRNCIIKTLTDPTLLLFWKKEFMQMGSYQRAGMVSPITNKIGRFLTSPMSKYILNQKTSLLNFEDIMNTGKILLCNLSKGKIGEDTSSLFGALITAKIQLASFKRVFKAEEQRKDFYLYIDEFQNFATSSFAGIMSEARKYRLNAILAHQTIAQIEDHDLTKVILANTGTVISFRASTTQDQEFILPFFAPSVTKADIANLPSFNFYMKINAPIPQDAFSGETIHVENVENIKLVENIKTHSRNMYAVSKESIAKEIQEEFQALITTIEQERRDQAEKKKIKTKR